MPGSKPGDLDILRLRDALSFRRASFSQVGPDVIFDGELEPRSAGMPEAIWFGGPQQVEIRQEADAPVGPDDVRVRALISGVSAGSELLVYRGNARALQPDLPTVRGDFGFPIKFAYANVGRVVEVGSRVDLLAVDDLVFVHHPHQTEYVVPTPDPLPEGLPADVGVFAANLETAVTVVLDAHPGSENRCSSLARASSGC